MWYCVSENYCVIVLCYDCHKYMHLKIIDHMNRIIYMHNITEHYPENVLSRLKKEVERCCIYSV